MYLVTADLHLTDRPQDADRFGIFNFLEKQQDKHNPLATFILGDLTNHKDKHSATLTNKMVEGLAGLQPPVYVLQGNHDYIDPENAFFRFVRFIEGIKFITSPKVISWSNQPIGLLPHIKAQVDFDTALRSFSTRLDYLFIHQCVEGAIAETGARLNGTNTAVIEKIKPRLGTYAGDIHRPQTAGPVTYVGAPYHVRFGDNFEPRVLLLGTDGKEKDLFFDCPRKWSLHVREADEILTNPELVKGDQVKVTVELAREEAVEWREHRQQVLEACHEMGLQVFGVDLKINKAAMRKQERGELAPSRSPKDVVTDFCVHERASSHIREAGIALLEE